MSASRTQTVEIVRWIHVNGSGRLFGGQLLQWMDVTGAVAARRHAESEVVTAALDGVVFKTPALPNDTVALDAYLTWVGRSSMEVKVVASVERLGGARESVCSAYAVYVAIDREGNSHAVPTLRLESAEERAEFDAGALRSAERKR